MDLQDSRETFFFLLETYDFKKQIKKKKYPTTQLKEQRILWGKISKNLCNFHIERPLWGKVLFFFFYLYCFLGKSWPFLKVQEFFFYFRLKFYFFFRLKTKSIWQCWGSQVRISEITVWLWEQDRIHRLSSEALGWDHGCLTPAPKAAQHSAPGMLYSLNTIIPAISTFSSFLFSLPLSPSASSLECSPISTPSNP